MSAGTWATLATSVAAVLGALATYLKQRTHNRDPHAHLPPPR